MRILQSGLYTFAKVRTRRIHLTRTHLVSDHLLYPRDLYVRYRSDIVRRHGLMTALEGKAITSKVLAKYVTSSVRLSSDGV